MIDMLFFDRQPNKTTEATILSFAEQSEKQFGRSDHIDEERPQKMLTVEKA
jgi:hypothetical protein